MIDDDIEGFYPDWIDDLAVPLRDAEVVMVSARLLSPEKLFGPTCSRCYETTPHEIEVRGTRAGRLSIPSFKSAC